MNILVTGGCGFVGSHLIEELLKEGHKTYCLDNLFTGDAQNMIEGCEYYEGETKDISKLFGNIKIDIVYHLGEYSRVEQSFEDIDLVFSYNWNSIYSVLSFVKDNDAKLIYSGSSTKFGDDGETKYSSPYAYTKYENTNLIKTFSDWFGIEYAIAYFYNVYGPREIKSGKYATVIAKFIELKKNGATKLPITAPGTQKRNFTHVKDIISGLILVGKFGKGDGYGIGSYEPFSIIEIAKLLDLEYEIMPKKKGNRMSAPVLTDKIVDLGWSQKYFLNDYLKGF